MALAGQTGKARAISSTDLQHEHALLPQGQLAQARSMAQKAAADAAHQRSAAHASAVASADAACADLKRQVSACVSSLQI